ncbi:hypothetical protein ADK74_16790 [Streptomyces decoyicus]|nr:hypothetical protein ADK74_16790 [Streptomyces decoyicus]
MREGDHGSSGAFFVVHVTMCDPFQVKATGTLRGVPSLATQDGGTSRAAGSSRLIGGGSEPL